MDTQLIALNTVDPPYVPHHRLLPSGGSTRGLGFEDGCCGQPLGWVEITQAEMGRLRNSMPGPLYPGPLKPFFKLPYNVVSKGQGAYFG